MDDLYIKLQDNKPVNHPVLGSNLRQVLVVEELTQEVLDANGYAKYKGIDTTGYSVISEDGYKMLDDGTVTNILTLEAWTQEHKVDQWIRNPRNNCLYGCDWTQGGDSPLSPEKKAEWAKYRQQLRDLPQVYADIQHPSEIVIPTPPK